MASNYETHLYYENNPNSEEYKLNKCINVLGLIAILKDRNRNIIQVYKTFYQNDKLEGKLKKDFDKNKEMINRLKSYYNYCLSKLNTL